jgi:hypothetical protein
MPLHYVIGIPHKHQTKANDCWYACTQMLLTWKNGVKTKPAGAHTNRLHSGLFGHTLHADYLQSKHLSGVLQENGLRLLTTRDVDFNHFQSVYSVLNRYGPISVGGNFGEVLRHLIKGMGHYIVIAGVDEANRRFWVHDPWHTKPQWTDQARVVQLAWYDDDSQFACA